MTATVRPIPPPPPAPDPRGLFATSPFRSRVDDAGVPVDVRCARPESTVAHVVDGVGRRFAQPCTFTPFASAQPCSARCRFCSETLVDRAATTLSATLRPGPDYDDALGRALAAVRPIPLGLSLSGLEYTDDLSFFSRVFAAAMDHVEHGGTWTDAVLYSNGNGLHPRRHGRVLGPRLAAFGLTRVELSRHARSDDAIARIMRFRDDAAVTTTEAFAESVRLALDHVPVRLVCVLQEGGVATLDDVTAYLAWARGLGVRDVVFRELSRLGARFVENATTRYVAAARVPVERVLDALWPAGRAPSSWFRPTHVTAGYYYWNLRGVVDDMRVTFETSDYTVMKDRHASDVVHKLVFHANGNLCADWDPETAVLLRAGTTTSAFVPLRARRKAS